MYFTPYLLPYIASAVVTFILFLCAVRFRDLPVARAFSVAVGLGVLWAALYVTDIASLSLKDKIFWSSLRFASVPFIPLALLSVALNHAGLGGLMRRSRLLFFCIPVITSLLSLAGSPLIRSDFFMDLSKPLPVLGFAKGPWYSLHIGYSYALVILAFGILVRSLRDAKPLYRNKTVIIIAGFTCVFVLDILFNLRILSLTGFNPAPAALAPVYLIIGWTLLRYRLFDIVPTAWSLAVENMEDPVFLINHQGTIVDFNPRAKAVFSPEAEIIPGCALVGLIPQANLWVGQGGEGRTVSEEIKVSTEKGQSFFHVSHLPVKDPDGRILGRLITFHDVTDLIVARRALEEAKEEAERANGAKSEFLATMSHEIRTPLNAVIGLAGLLADGPADPSLRCEYAAMLRSSGTLLSNLLNNVLDISRIEAGKITIESVPFDLRLVIREVMEPFFFMAGQKGLSMTVRYGDTLPSRLLGDHGRLSQVVANFVDNAIKFTEKGSVTVTVDGKGFRADTAAMDLVVSVADTGIGIDAAFHERIFDRFACGHGSPSIHGGSGLGLAIARGIIETMGGTITVESRPGKGSLFTFSVPVVVGNDDKTGAAGPNDGGSEETMAAGRWSAGREILLVEDNYFSQRVLGDLLKSQGHRVTVAGGGEETLTRIREKQFDLVLMDMRMPDMDGYTVVRKIREAGDHVVIIAVTAEAVETVREQCNEKDVYDVLTKPVPFGVLLGKIEELWPRERKEEGGNPKGGVIFDPAAIPGLAPGTEAFDTYVTLFEKDIHRTLFSLVEASAQDDLVAVERLAHTLKGTAGVLEGKRMSAIAARLEEAAVAGDRRAVTGALVRLIGEYKKIATVADLRGLEKSMGDE